MPDTFASAESSAVPPPLEDKRAPRPSHWGRWLLGLLALLGALVLVAQHYLDPWLRRALEKQVTTQTHGQYRLQVGALHTSLWQRAIRLSQLHLRPAAQVADTLPRLRLDVAQVNVTGVGLLALLRKGVVPLDSVVLDSARLEVLALPTRPTKNAGKPLHEQLPLRLKGLEIHYLGFTHTRAAYGPAAQPTAGFQRADLSAHDVRISPAGAADSQRLGYAADWSLLLRQGQGQVAGHRVALGAVRLSSRDRWVELDSVRVQPAGPPQPQRPRLDLALPRLRLTGLNAAALRHRHHFQADSLLIQGPQLTFSPALRPAPAPKGNAAPAEYLRRLDLGHLAVRNGYVRVVGTEAAPVAHDVNVAATAVHYAAGAAPDVRDFFFARAWDVALGSVRATVAAHALALGSLHFSTAAGSLDLRALRIQPPAPGQGKPGGVRVDLALPSLAVRGFDAAAVQHRHYLRVSSVVVERPRLDFTPPKQPPPPVWKLVANFLRRTDVAQLRVLHAEGQVGGLRHAPEVHDVTLTGRAIRIDSAAAQDPGRVAYARGWQANSGLIALPFDPPYYRATIQHARLDTEAKALRLEDLALTPKYSPVGMNQHKGYQVPAMLMKISSLTATGLDFAGLVRRADVRVARVSVQSPEVHINSDGRGPINPHKSKISPEEMRNLPMKVDVRRLDIVNGNLYSSYRSPLTPIPGTLSINRFNGSFYNLSNDPQRQTPATPLTGTAYTYLQNQCRLDAQVSMYLLDPLGRHRVWGAFGAGPFGMLNSMTVPTRLVEFKKGDVQHMRFDMQVDRKGTTGTMWAEYSGLQLELLGYKQEEVKKTLLKSLVSKAANVIVIRDQNPRKRGELVTGHMTSTREPRFSVFTLWRQGMVSGLFDNVGVPQKLAQKLSETKDEAPLPK